MSHITKAQQGLAAVEARKWDEAISKLSDALKESQNPTWLVARSKALIGAGRFQESLGDANIAWHKAYERNKRPLLGEAHYRRAVAYFRLGQPANADACCVYSMRIAKGFPAKEKDDPVKQLCDENGFYNLTQEQVKEEMVTDEMFKRGSLDAKPSSEAEQSVAKEWRAASAFRMQALGAMERLPANDAGRKVTTSLVPEFKDFSDAKVIEKLVASQAPALTEPVIPSDTPLRLQDFQSSTNMSVSIFSKGVDKEKLQVKFSPFSAHLDPMIYPNGEEKAYQLDLWGEIDPDESKYTVTPNKVELSLKKKTPGKWVQLKGESRGASEAVETSKPSTALPESPKLSDKPASSAAYPTSSRGGPKNWDAVVKDEDDDDGKDVNLFFKKLFKNATPEQQRAMMKSFTESSGTSLSTDWDDVKDRTVETVPPEGVEAKKWD